MSFEIKGLQELQNKLQGLSRRAQQLDGEHSVSFSELFNKSFLQQYTRFSSISEMFEKSGFKVENKDDFKAIPDDKWDEFIQAHTQFKNWKEMQQKAAAVWTKNKLGL
jgi:hypothetical protein